MRTDEPVSMSARGRNERGFVAVFAVLCLSAFLFGLAALGVDLSRLYVEAQRVQKAADAAALAAVPYMPADLAGATTAGQDLARRNGFDNASAQNSVSVERGDHATEAHATVCTTFKTTFAGILGVGTITVCRDAVADYTGPQPMGSPCNTLGNEPAGTPGSPTVASQLKIPTSATCSTNPQFWMSAAGPEVYKTQGDEYDTRVCGGTEADCTGTSNDEFNPNGYFLLVRVSANAVSKPVTLQLYDPAYVSTASACGSGPTGTISSDNWNSYASTDAKARYSNTSNAFCAGDNNNSGLRRGATEVPTVTSFGLRAPIASGNPLDAPPVSADCTRQYPGYTAPTAASLKSGDATYNDNVARVFHEWVTLCTFTPTVAGDYYLQVRTNVALQGAVNFEGGYKPTAASSASIYTQSGDDPAVLGNGTNRYAVRAYGTGLNAGDVSVSALGKMPIFANADSATTTFNLIRVLPGAAGKNLIFQFFDVGEGSGTGATLTVQRPGDATGDALNKCSASGYKTYSSLSGCSITGISNAAGWDGQAEVMTVPIPANYNCNSSSTGGCWFTIKVAFGPGSTVTDATTWTASISGQPVRLLR